jgi:hypothetical protein
MTSCRATRLRPFARCFLARAARNRREDDTGAGGKHAGNDFTAMYETWTFPFSSGRWIDICPWGSREGHDVCRLTQRDLHSTQILERQLSAQLMHRFRKRRQAELPRSEKHVRRRIGCRRGVKWLRFLEFGSYLNVSRSEQPTLSSSGIDADSLAGVTGARD